MRWKSSRGQGHVRAAGVAGVFTGWALLATLATPLVAVQACDATVTESDLQKWTNNDIGLARIEEVVVDATQPMDTRIRALEVVVEKGFPVRVRGFVDAIHDDADRAEVMRRLAEQLLRHVEKRSAYQFDAKDALMSLDRHLPPDAFEPVQKAVAAWAFGDLDWKTPTAEVQEKIQARISSGQIMDLGRHGWQGAGILVKNGFVVDKMARYLGEAKDPEATRILLDAMRELHATTGPQSYHIDALRGTESPAAAAYLLEMYLNEEIDEEFRAGAFNVAVSMFGAPSVTSDPKVVVDKLLELLDTKVPEDRWLAANNLVQLSGVAQLGAIFAALKDDGVYKQATEDPAKSVMDLCLDIHDLGLGEKAAPRLREALTTGNRVVKAVAIVCLKANGVEAARDELAAIAATAGTKDDVDINDFLGEELTLGRLAANAVDGLTALATLEADRKAGKYGEEQHKTRRLITIFELALTGDEYRAAIEERYEGWAAEQKALEEQRKRDEAEGDKPATPEGAAPTEGEPAAPEGEPAAPEGEPAAP